MYIKFMELIEDGPIFDVTKSCQGAQFFSMPEIGFKMINIYITMVHIYSIYLIRYVHNYF